MEMYRGPHSQKEPKMVESAKMMDKQIQQTSDATVLNYLKTMEASLMDQIATLTTHVEEIKLTVTHAIMKAEPLKLEEGIVPIITYVTRVGSKANSKRTIPRDIVATNPMQE
ncbi:UNVERIFIED_CONTAM: hypothetical protein K2H54_023885 [Gekko kuhli]